MPDRDQNPFQILGHSKQGLWLGRCTSEYSDFLFHWLKKKDFLLTTLPLFRLKCMVIIMFVASILSGQPAYTFYLEDNQIFSSSQLSLAILDQKISGFEIDDKLIQIDKVKYLQIKKDFYKVQGLDTHNRLKLFKRNLDGMRIDLYYQTEIEATNYPFSRREIKRKQFYEKDNGKLKRIKYPLLFKDLSDSPKSKVFLLKAKKQKIWRNIFSVIGLGVLLYELNRLDREKSVNGLIVIPPMVFLASIPLSQSIHENYQKALIVYN